MERLSNECSQTKPQRSALERSRELTRIVTSPLCDRFWSVMHRFPSSLAEKAWRDGSKQRLRMRLGMIG